MKSNALIIGLLIIIIILIIGIGYSVISNQNNDNQTVNDTSDNNAENKTLNAVIVSNNDSNDTAQAKHYEDWQKDYETGEFDEYGSPIYRSVISTSGGQYEPGIYEAYWSENGPISEERIG